MYDDTIAAIATPPGEGGLGIVRLSGPDAWSIVGALFDGALEDRRVVHGWIRDPATGDTIDEVMVTPLAGPKTYTRESIVEIGCHGSPLVLQRVLQLALNRGARLANPGEFTLRAFLNGRLDLSRAEAVLDVIQAKTQANLRFAVQGMQGRLSESLSHLRQRILTVQAYLTACIDFPEDEVESQIDIDPKAALAEAMDELRQLIEVAEAGMIYRNGVRTAIVGKPNVGKSSLLNRLLGEDRSIVTAVPGTTRDTVEEAMQIAGIPFHLIDTAGIHETRDTVEHLGVERSRQAARSADLLLVVVDGSEALSEADFRLLAMANEQGSIVIVNKCDLRQEADLSALPATAIQLSALTGDGIGSLHDAMAKAGLGDKVIPSDAAVVTDPRQKAALDATLAHVTTAHEALEQGSPEDFVTIDLASALSSLGQITGEDASEELLDAIFQRFCIGK